MSDKITLSDKLSIDAVEYASRANAPVKTRVRKGPLAPARPCAVCKEPFAPHRKNPDAKFCSRECQWVGIGAERWTKTMGKITAKKRGDTQRDRGAGKTYRKRDGRHEHRGVAEQILGRSLLPSEVVHHKDGNKRNNAPDNISVLPSQSDHARLHFAGKKQSAEHIRNRVESRRRKRAKRMQGVGG